MSATSSDELVALCELLTSRGPVSESPLGYQPNLGANVFFLVIFALCALAQLVLGVYHHTWTFAIALVLGCVCEVIGYAGRIVLGRNPWNDTGFDMQLVCLLVAPTFLSAGAYLSLKHFVLTFGEEYSVIKAQNYTWLFITADVLSFVLQAIGSAVAAASRDLDTIQSGENVAVTGICWQVFSLVMFGICALAYRVRVHRHRDELRKSIRNIYRSPGCRAYCVGLIVACVAILLRCVYRIPELASGWRSDIMGDEPSFMVLDGGMIAVAVVALTVVHPGYCFKPLFRRYSAKVGEDYIDKNIVSLFETV